MANLTAKIIGLVGGDDLEVRRTITNIPTGQVLAQARFTVKLNEDDLDAAAIFQKSITSTLVASQGQITDTGANGTGVVSFFLQASDTVLMTPGSEYHYDIQVRLDNNRLYTPEKGRITTVRQITQSTT